jgi:tripartite-type tricarboxylate transporter receptor subunit TctC
MNAGLKTVTAAGCFLAVVCAFAGVSAAAEVSFQGKQVNIIIGSKPGGGTDGEGRLLGSYLGKYLPGHPTITYSNIPGSSGIKAINHFTQRTKADGTSLLTASSVSLEPTTLRNKAVVKYDPREFAIVGGLSAGGTVMIMKADAKSRLTDKNAAPVVVGAVDATRTGLSMALWGAEFLGWNTKWVIGYSGTSALMMAVQQGEIDMTGTSNLFHLKKLMETGKFVGVVQAGDLEDGKFVPRMAFRDAPVLPDLVGTKVDGVAKEAFESWLYSNQVGKWFALPPKTPDDVVETYRAAYQKVMKDPQFLEQAHKQFSADFEPMSANDVTLVIKALASTSDEALNYMTKLRVKHGLPAN